MVNTGKPSGACGVCRERRIKCDETKPACLKCIRSGRPCSGYSHGLKLRDQTQKTIIKARLGKPRGRRQSQDQGKKSPTTPKTPKTPKTQKTPPSAGDAAQRDTTRPRSLSLPTNDDPEANGRDAEKGHARRHSTGVVKSRHQVWPLEGGADTLSWQAVHTPLVEKARCYFLASYVVYGPNNPGEGMFTFIPPILQSDSPTKQHFEDLFTSVSIAAFSMRPNASHAVNHSRYYYARGVTHLRKALADKDTVKSDAVLASTILLGFYEGIVNEGSGVISYNPHFEGALALLRIRDEEQFSTKHGTEMFDFVMQVLMRQYELSLEVTEDDLCRWTVQAAMHSESSRPHLVAMWVGDLRLRVDRLLKAKQRDAGTHRAALEILSAAQKFERMVSKRFEAEDPDLLGEKRMPSVFEDHPAAYTIVYADWWTATRSLNKYAFRLLLCHLIADTCEWLEDGPGNPCQFMGAGQRAAAIARNDIDNIIASVPYLCAWGSGEPRGASSPCGRGEIASVEGITSFLVVWPLYLAGDSRFATQVQKDYIQHKLGWIGETVGVKHASGVSKHLKLLASGSVPSTPHRAQWCDTVTA